MALSCQEVYLMCEGSLPTILARAKRGKPPQSFGVFGRWTLSNINEEHLRISEAARQTELERSSHAMKGMGKHSVLGIGTRQTPGWECPPSNPETNSIAPPRAPELHQPSFDPFDSARHPAGVSRAWSRLPANLRSGVTAAWLNSAVGKRPSGAIRA